MKAENLPTNFSILNISDIDIAIICPTATSLQWLQLVRIIENSDTLLKIDCVRFDKAFIGEDLYHNILRDKIIIYSNIKNYYRNPSFTTPARKLQEPEGKEAGSRLSSG